jgi:hypothetical protein
MNLRGLGQSDRISFCLESGIKMIIFFFVRVGGGRIPRNNDCCKCQIVTLIMGEILKLGIEERVGTHTGIKLNISIMLHNL